MIFFYPFATDSFIFCQQNYLTGADLVLGAYVRALPFFFRNLFTFPIVKRLHSAYIMSINSAPYPSPTSRPPPPPPAMIKKKSLHTHTKNKPRARLKCLLNSCVSSIGKLGFVADFHHCILD